MIVLTRIDSRLVHGQVIEAWLPHLHVQRIVVADDVAAADPLTRAAISLAVPSNVEVRLQPIQQIDFHALHEDTVRTLVLLRDVAAAVQAKERGLPNGALNLGNVHSTPLRRAVSRSVFLSDDERGQLAVLSREGMAVSVQAVPNETPMAFP